MIVGLGGFIGTIARFVISRYFQLSYASVFPWAILLVNVAGCLLIGIVYGLTDRGNLLTPEIRLFLTVGICGGFTTFSTFSDDAFLLLRQQEFIRFAFYTSGNFFLGLLAIYAGRIIPKIL